MAVGSNYTGGPSRFIYEAAAAAAMEFSFGPRHEYWQHKTTLYDILGFTDKLVSLMTSAYDNFAIHILPRWLSGDCQVFKAFKLLETL